MPTDGNNSFDLTGGELLIMKKGQSLPTNDLCQSERWFSLSQSFKIIWLSNLLIFSIPDEGYSRNASCTLN